MQGPRYIGKRLWSLRVAVEIASVSQCCIATQSVAKSGASVFRSSTLMGSEHAMMTLDFPFNIPLGMCLAIVAGMLGLVTCAAFARHKSAEKEGEGQRLRPRRDTKQYCAHDQHTWIGIGLRSTRGLCVIVQWLALALCLGSATAYGAPRYLYRAYVKIWLPKELARVDVPHDMKVITATPSMLKSAQIPSLPGGVPKVLHQISLRSPLASWDPQNIAKVSAANFRWIQSWDKFHVNWLHILWTDVDVRQFLLDKHPDALPVYDSYPHAVMRADMARAYILWTYGGVYADLDFEAKASIEPALQDHGMLVLESPYKKYEDVQNSLMASRPGHPFWKFLLQKINQHQVQPNQFHIDIMSSTGPALMSKCVKDFMSTRSPASPDAVGLLSSSRFMFGIDTEQGPGVSLHHFEHSWFAENAKDDIRRVAMMVFVGALLAGLYGSCLLQILPKTP